MILISVESVEITQKSGTMRNGKPYPREQTVWAYLCDSQGKIEPHPTRAKLTLWDADQPVAVGKHTLAPQSVRVDGYGGFILAPKLVSSAGGRGGA